MDSFYTAESINTFFIDQIKGYAIFAIDAQGIIKTWNKGAERLKGYTEEEVIGKEFSFLFPEEYRQTEMHRREMESALREGSYESKDWRMKKDGSLFWAYVLLTPIQSQDGRHIGFTKITGDLSTERELRDNLAIRQQRVLQRKNDELQKVADDLDNFVYTASHDLRAPICNIEVLLGMLKEEMRESGCLSEFSADLLEKSTSSVGRFKRTLADLADINLVHNEFSEGHQSEISNVNQLCEDIMEEIRYPFDLGSCFVKTDFQVYRLKFPRRHLRSILYNLISNAAKYRSPERTCLIDIQTRLEEPYVVLSVKDNGLGIKKENQKDLFTMFKRFHDHVEGTGMGLYMVNRIIGYIGGKVEVESEEGSGTEIRVYFTSAL